VSVDLVNVHVFVPGPYGLVVCDLADLVGRCCDDDYEDLDAVLEDAGFDMEYPYSDLRTLIDKVRALNLTGDINAYWGINQAEQS